MRLVFTVLVALFASSTANAATFDQIFQSVITENGQSCESVTQADPFGRDERDGMLFVIGCSDGDYHLTSSHSNGVSYIASFQATLKQSGQACGSITEVSQFGRSKDSELILVTIGCSSGDYHVMHPRSSGLRYVASLGSTIREGGGTCEAVRDVEVIRYGLGKFASEYGNLLYAVACSDDSNHVVRKKSGAIEVKYKSTCDDLKQYTQFQCFRDLD